MPYDSIRINFQYGYTGNSSLNTLATTKHNRTCKTMVNFIPMADGSAVKRAPVEEVVLSFNHKTLLMDHFKKIMSKPNPSDHLGFFVHAPGGSLQVPVFILGAIGSEQTKYFASMPGTVEPATHTCDWIKEGVIGRATVESISIATLIVDVDMHHTFGQIVSYGGPEPYSFYMQQIVLRNGPCGSQERKDGSLYKWHGYTDAVRDQYQYTANPGDKIEIRFHPDVGMTYDDLEGYRGATFAFNVPVTTSKPFQKSSGDQVTYVDKESVVHHGDNMYLCWGKGYKPGTDAPPPTHTVPGEIIYYSDGNYSTDSGTVGGWLFLNKGTGYARLYGTVYDSIKKHLYGRFEVQTALSPLHFVDNDAEFFDENWPSVSESSWNLPVYGPKPGFFEACCVAFDRLWLGGGRDTFTASTELSLSIDLDRANSVFGSETSDWENFDELIEGPTRARAISVSSRGGSPVVGLKALDPQTLGIFYRDGLSILLLDSDGNITTKEAANLRPADKPYGCKFGPYTCCIGANRKNVVGAIYRYENNTQVTVDLLGPIYETIGQTTIKRMFSIGGTPEKLVLLRDDGVITVLFLINGSEVGFYDVVTEYFIFDISCTISHVYMLHYKDLGSGNYDVMLTRLDLEHTDHPGPFVELGGYVEAYIEVNSILAPTDVSQETWISADMIHSVKINKSRNPAKVNGQDVDKGNLIAKNSIMETTMNEDYAIRISSNSQEPLIIHWIEVAYERAAIMKG